MAAQRHSFTQRMIDAARVDAAIYTEVEHDAAATGQAAGVVAIVAGASAIGGAAGRGRGRRSDHSTSGMAPLVGAYLPHRGQVARRHGYVGRASPSRRLCPGSRCSLPFRWSSGLGVDRPHGRGNLGPDLWSSRHSGGARFLQWKGDPHRYPRLGSHDHAVARAGGARLDKLTRASPRSISRAALHTTSVCSAMECASSYREMILVQNFFEELKRLVPL